MERVAEALRSGARGLSELAVITQLPKSILAQALAQLEEDRRITRADANGHYRLFSSTAASTVGSALSSSGVPRPVGPIEIVAQVCAAAESVHRAREGRSRRVLASEGISRSRLREVEAGGAVPTVEELQVLGASFPEILSELFEPVLALDAIPWAEALRSLLSDDSARTVVELSRQIAAAHELCEPESVRWRLARQLVVFEKERLVIVRDGQVRLALGRGEAESDISEASLSSPRLTSQLRLVLPNGGVQSNSGGWGEPPVPLLPKWYVETENDQWLPPWLQDLAPGVMKVADLPRFWELSSTHLDWHLLGQLLSDLDLDEPPEDLDVLPAGWTESELSGLHLSTRSTNALRRGLSRLSLTDGVSVGALMRLPNFGVRSLIEVMCVVEASLQQHRDAPADSRSRSVQDVDGILKELRTHTDVPLGELLPGLLAVADEPIASPYLDTRSAHALKRRGCRRWGDLATNSVAEFESERGVGAGTVSRILQAVAHRHLEVGSLVLEPPGGPGGQDSGTPEPDDGGLFGSELQGLLADLATWAVRERGATRLADLIRLAPALGRVPRELLEAFDTLCSTQLGVLAGSGSAALPSELASQLLDDADGNVDVFTARRLRGGPRPTLEELGRGLGVTRERVRQLEKATAESVLSLLETSTYRPLRWRALDLRDALGPAVPARGSYLDEAMARAVAGLEEAEGFRLADLMLWIAGPYEENHGWLVRAGASLDDLAVEFNDKFRGEVVLDMALARSALDELGLNPGTLESFLKDSRVWREIGQGTWVHWAGGLGNKAEIVLKLLGHPCVASDVNEHIGEGHATSSVRNIMAQDDRFVRVDKAGRYALAEWGLEEYSGIANEIRERIERAGGAASLEELVDEFVIEFGVSESSVRTYAATPAFVVEAGRVRLRGASEPFEANGEVSQFHGLYVRPGGEVVVHDVVDRDVVRGSGRTFPEAGAVALGLQPGDRRAFTLKDGTDIMVSWPPTSTSGPSMGSPRRIVEALGLGEGDRYRLVLDPRSATGVAECVDASTLQGLTGLKIDAGHELETLAAAMQIAPSAVRAQLSRRHEDDVLALLPDYVPNEELSQALADFRNLLEG
jgi:hypothetical protein